MAWYFGALCEEVIERPRFDQTRLYPDLVQKTSTIDRFEIVSYSFSSSSLAFSSSRTGPAQGINTH